MARPIHGRRHVLDSAGTRAEGSARDVFHRLRRQDPPRPAREAGAPSARAFAPAAGEDGASGREHRCFRRKRSLRREIESGADRIPLRKAENLGGAGGAPPAPRRGFLPHRAQTNRPGELRGRARRHRDPVLTKVFLGYTQQELDAQYNQRAWVPHADELIARMAAASDAVRAKLGPPESISYGSSPL